MNLGLCIEGGGAKGAFSARILYELHKIFKKLDFVAASGSSVGGLNASLALIGEFEYLKRVWMDIRNTNVYIFLPSIFQKSLYSTKPLKRFLLKNIRNLGIIDKIKKLNKKLFLCSLILETNQLYYFSRFKNDYELLRGFMATSSIPFLFPPQIIGGNHYIDGGTKTSLPVDPLIDEGVKKIICIAHSPINKSVNFRIKNIKDYINSLIEAVTINHTVFEILKWEKVNNNLFLYRGLEIFLIYPEIQLPPVLDFSKESLLISENHAITILNKIKTRIENFLL